MSDPALVLRYSRSVAIPALAGGALFVLSGLLGGWFLLVPGVVFLGVGVVFARRPVQARVVDGELQMVSPFGKVLRRYPVEGPGDLRIDRNLVVHVPTDTRTASLGLGMDQRDAAAWREWIGG